jgi:hypothetical protein
MPRYRYYYEYNSEEDVFDVLEEDGGYEHGAYFDVLLFSTASTRDAQDAVNVLTKLASKILKKG